MSIAGLVDFGHPFDGNDKRREKHYELADVASLAKHRHLFSFGADLDWIRENVSVYDGFAAVYIFPTLNPFLKGEPHQYRQPFGSPTPHFSTPQNSSSLPDHCTPPTPLPP